MYNSSDIANKIKQRAKQQNVPIKKLLSDIGLGFNTMSHMKTSMPNSENLAKIADYLDCSVDYLLGRDLQPQKKASPSFDELALSAIVDDTDMTNAFTILINLSAENLSLALKFLYFLAYRQENKGI